MLPLSLLFRRYAVLTGSTAVLFVQCSAVHQCPEHMSCCRLFTGEWGCCPLPNAVCCGDKEHCCPEGYTCDLASKSCHKLLTLQLETVPLTPVFLPDDQSQRGPVKPILNRCDDVYSCNVDETCCRTSHTTWGCCLSPNKMLLKLKVIEADIVLKVPHLLF
uniref:Granulin a n=1 Tax=Oryzias sinensis TaxID=183150 RepID=A0A8C7YGZ5_9TELE